MSRSDNYGMPYPIGKIFPREDDIPQDNKGEILIPSSCCSGTSLHPPPLIILPNPQVQRLEKFKVTQTLLARKHQDGRSVCTHVLEMKSHIDRMGMLGVVVSRKLAVDWVLQSLPKSYSEFIKDYYIKDRDMSLIDLTYLLIAAESEMIWRTGKANSIGRSTFQTSMDIDIGNIGSPEKISLPKGKGKAKSEIIPCTIPKEFVCLYCQEKGHWKRSCPDYLRDLRDGIIKLYGSASGKIEEEKGSLKKEQDESDREEMDFDRMIR
ncbi:hypothetical protein Lser_V15G21970 [Lactuca serriola]